MDCYDAAAFIIALVSEDFTETGWSRDPSKRNEGLKAFGVAPRRRRSDSDDPMLTPPPAELAEEQLAEIQALMARSNPPNPPTD